MCWLEISQIFGALSCKSVQAPRRLKRNRLCGVGFSGQISHSYVHPSSASWAWAWESEAAMRVRERAIHTRLASKATSPSLSNGRDNCLSSFIHSPQQHPPPSLHLLFTDSPAAIKFTPQVPTPSSSFWSSWPRHLTDTNDRTKLTAQSDR